MKWKKRIGIIMVLLMGCMLFGCGEEASNTEEQTEKSQSKDIQLEETKSEEDSSNEEKIVWYISQYSVAPQISSESMQSNTALDCKIYDEFNKKLKEKGFEKSVEFRTIVYEPNALEDSDTYFYKMLEELKEMEAKVDIFPYMGYRGELAYDFSKELSESESGKLLYKQIPEKIWNVLSENGAQYYIYNNNVQTLARCAGYEWNKELVEKYGLKEEDLKKSPEQLMDLFEKEKQAGSVCSYPIYDWYNQLYMYGNYDYLGGGELELLFVASTDPENPSVQNIYENEDYISAFELLHTSQEKGYSSKDGKSTGEELVRNILYGMPEREDRLAEQNDTIRVARSQPYFSINLPYRTQCIASWSEQKEDVLELLALVMSDSELSNILNYGIEGENYEVKDGVVTALDLVGEKMLQRAGSLDSIGNTAITLPMELEPANKKECYEKYVESIEAYPAIGFIPDYSSVKEQYEACREIIGSQHDIKGTLFNGTAGNVEEELSKINTQLKEAGIENVLAELNRQLQEYIKTKSVK